MVKRIADFVLRSPKVTVKKIVEKTQKPKSGGIEGLHILAVQDTMSFRDDRSENSTVGDAMTAVETEQGCCSERSTCNSLNALVAARSCPLRENESYRWLEGM